MSKALTSIIFLLNSQLIYIIIVRVVLVALKGKSLMSINLHVSSTVCSLKKFLAIQYLYHKALTNKHSRNQIYNMYSGQDIFMYIVNKHYANIHINECALF